MPDTHEYADTDMVSIGTAAEITGFAAKTLRRWDKAGRLRVYRTPAGRRQYKVGDLRNVVKEETPSSDESNGSAA